MGRVPFTEKWSKASNDPLRRGPLILKENGAHRAQQWLPLRSCDHDGAKMLGKQYISSLGHCPLCSLKKLFPLKCRLLIKGGSLLWKRSSKKKGGLHSSALYLSPRRVKPSRVSESPPGYLQPSSLLFLKGVSRSTGLKSPLVHHVNTILLPLGSIFLPFDVFKVFQQQQQQQELLFL